MLTNLKRHNSAVGNAPNWNAQHIGRAAIAAMYDELALAPKPGLVSFVDTGSHFDMDATTFMRSLFALRHYFPRIALLGAAQAPFEELEALGIRAETQMLKATAGINTHRGTIFTMGLLCAAAGSLTGRPCALVLRETLMNGWGKALRARRQRGTGSNGQRVIEALGLRGADEEAAEGFPVLFERAVPALSKARYHGLDDQHARLQTFFEIMSVLDDTNLAHRGALAGLRYAQSEARSFLDAGGAFRSDAIVHAQRIHKAFVVRRLSPGGAADVLAAAGFVERICRST